MSALLSAVLESGAPFFVFVAACLFVALRDRPGRTARERRPWIQGLLVVALAASFGSVIVGRNYWPFCKWPLVAGVVPEVVDHPRFLAVDAQGVEHDVDWRAWQPLSVDELTSWAGKGLPALGDGERERALGYLLAHVEAARARARGGGPLGSFDRFLGPLAAPLFLLHPVRWRDPESTPPAPFVALRLYRERWNTDERALDPGAVTRELQFEVRAP